MKEISVKELKKMMDEGEDFHLIDVRNQNEYDFCQIGGELIPLGIVPDNVDKFPKDKPVVVHCRSGKRSADAIAFLEQNHGYTNLINLAGGILAWSDEVDSSIPKY